MSTHTSDTHTHTKKIENWSIPYSEPEHWALIMQDYAFSSSSVPAKEITTMKSEPL